MKEWKLGPLRPHMNGNLFMLRKVSLVNTAKDPFHMPLNLHTRTILLGWLVITQHSVLQIAVRNIIFLHKHVTTANNPSLYEEVTSNGEKSLPIEYIAVNHVAVEDIGKL